MFECPAQSTAEPVADIDLAIDKVRLFRLERMDDGIIWIRLYRESGEDKVIWLDSSSAIITSVEDDKAEASLAQSDAEPVGWQWRYRLPPRGEWSDCRDERDLDFKAQYPDKYELRLTPPSPDASAGLIEAAEIVKDWSQACVKDSEANLLDALAKHLRARAADRSGK